jgi:hypothetical protein
VCVGGGLHGWVGGRCRGCSGCRRGTRGEAGGTALARGPPGRKDARCGVPTRPHLLVAGWQSGGCTADTARCGRRSAETGGGGGREVAAGGGCMERHVGRMCRAPLRAPPHLWVHEQRCTASADYVTMRARADSACRQRGWGRVGALNPDSGLPRPAAAPRGDPGLRRRLATAGRRDSTHRASLP